MGVDCLGFFQTHCYPEIKEHMVRMYKTAEFYGSTSQLLSNITKGTAFSVFKLLCAFLHFQNQEVGKVLGFFLAFLKCDSKTYPYIAEGSSEQGCFDICTGTKFSLVWDTVIAAHSPTEILHSSLALEEIGQNGDPHTGEDRSLILKYSLCL